MNFLEEIVKQSALRVDQEMTLTEVFGFETRNKYAIAVDNGLILGYAVEQPVKGVTDFMARLFFGHWRVFYIHVFDLERNPVLIVHHPFRWFLERLEISNAARRPIGALEQSPSLLSRSFDVQDATGKTRMTVSSPILRPGTFPFMRGGRLVAVVQKKWRGILDESLTDADHFRIEFKDPRLTTEERLLLIAAALFIDLQYFENQGG